MKKVNMPVIHGPFMDTYDYEKMITLSANTVSNDKPVVMNKKPKEKVYQKTKKPRGSIRGK